MEPLTNIETYQKNLQKLKTEVLYVEDSWVKQNLDSKNPLVLKGKDTRKVYLLKPVLRLAQQKEQEARVKLITIFQTYNKLLDANPTLGLKGSYTIGNKKENSEVNNNVRVPTPPPNEPGNLPDWISFNVTPEEVDFEKSYSLTYNKNPQAPENAADFAKYSADTTLIISLSQPPKEEPKPGQAPHYDKFYAFENKGNFLDKITQMEKSVNIKKNEITK